MSADIGKGDLVECIKADHGYWDGRVYCLVVGAVYEVEMVGPGRWRGVDLGIPSIRVVNDPLPDRMGWPLSWFRRLGPKRGAFDHLLAPPEKAKRREVVS